MENVFYSTGRRKESTARVFLTKGTGKITISAGTGVTLINRQSHTKTAGQYAVVTIVNIGSNQVILAGDTGN